MRPAQKVTSPTEQPKISDQRKVTTMVTATMEITAKAVRTIAEAKASVARAWEYRDFLLENEYLDLIEAVKAARAGFMQFANVKQVADELAGGPASIGQENTVLAAMSNMPYADYAAGFKSWIVVAMHWHKRNR